MKIETRSHALELPHPVRQQIERRLNIALRAFARHIDRLLISIRDVNGPRGGEDLLGQVVVRFRRGAPIVVRAKHERVNELVAQLATAVRRTVKSRIRRRKARLMRRFRSSQRPLPLVSAAGISPSSEQEADRTVQLAK